MAAKGIHHLGLAVDDLDEAISTYRRLFGAELEERARPEDRSGLVRRYRLMDIGRTEVAVPAEAARLLGSR